MVTSSPKPGSTSRSPVTTSCSCTRSRPTATRPPATTLYAGSGDDTIIAGSADDTVVASSTSAKLLYGSGTVSIATKAPYLNVAAGPNQTVSEGTPVTLQGSFVDPDDADVHTIDWHVVASSGQKIPDGSGPDFSFVPGNAGQYTVTYTVSDTNGGMEQAVVAVTSTAVAPVITPPTAAQNAVAGQSTSINLGTLAVAQGGVGPWSVTVQWGDNQSSTFSPSGSGRSRCAHLREGRALHNH